MIQSKSFMQYYRTRFEIIRVKVGTLKICPKRFNTSPCEYVGERAQRKASSENVRRKTALVTRCRERDRGYCGSSVVKSYLLPGIIILRYDFNGRGG